MPDSPAKTGRIVFHPEPGEDDEFFLLRVKLTCWRKWDLECRAICEGDEPGSVVVLVGPTPEFD